MGVADSTNFPDPKTADVRSSLPLAGECVTFTGTLASMTHRDAAALVETYGGRAVQAVSRSLTMLVVGEEGWPLEEDGATSQKLTQSSELIAEGANIHVVAESDWLHLIGLNERRDEIQRSYTPAMLSRVLQVPVGMIRRWARIGLIRPVRRVCRQLYFDFREVASAQRLAKLLDEGVRSDVLEASLTELSRTLAGTDRSLAQLTLLVQDEKVVLRDAHGVLNPRTGQRLLDFETTPQLSLMQEPETSTNSEATISEPHPLASVPVDDDGDSGDDRPPVTFSIVEARLRQEDRGMNDWSADDWFHEGCRLAEEGAFDSAENAFRNCLTILATDHAMLQDPQRSLHSTRQSIFPDPADVHFHLADALYRAGRTEAAIERYHCAIECAPDFIEAWTQLGCLQTERGHWIPAEEALLTAISIHSSNPDALLHYAQLLEQMNRTQEALTWWEKYLRFDSRGPWADHARRRLAETTPVAE
ncbi:MAG: tetratricopeptide repeat protein [Planctomycetaceae bacterium]